MQTGLENSKCLQNCGMCLTSILDIVLLCTQEFKHEEAPKDFGFLLYGFLTWSQEDERRLWQC